MRRASLLLLLATACPGGDPEPKPDVGGTKAESDAFRVEAQREAIDLLLPLAEAALVLHDPVSAFALDLAPFPRLPPVTAARAEPTRKKLDTAWTEAAGIEADIVGPAPAVLVSLVRFALSRARDQLVRRRPSRDDPGFVVVETERVVQALEVDAADGTCDACDDAMPALAEDLGHTLDDLGGASEAAAIAAADDLAALADRVAALPSAEATSTALRRASDHLREIAAALPNAAPAEYAKAMPPARTSAAALRLPARLPADELRRRLEVAEDRDEPARELFTALGPTLARLRKMAESRSAKDDRDAPTPVDVARCDAAWAPIAAHVATQPVLAKAKLDCAIAVRRLAGRSLRPSELTVALVDFGVVDPIRDARRREEPAVLGLVAGRIAPASQRHAFRLAVLTGLEDDAAILVALADARASACLAATALWIHGELGTDEDLGKRLAAQCPDRPPADWIARAEARPMSALSGLALDRLGSGPADVVPLDRYWWAPAGFVSLLANPELAARLPTTSKVEAKVEDLDSPPAPAASSAEPR